ncbi:receptor-type tyrosine-protein phosphatase mu-like [Saccostrea cucullata]
MIWQENIEYIVMLTNLIEGPKKKCHQYWSNEDEALELEPFSVTLVEEKVYAYYVIRVLNLKKREVTGSRTVVQFHYTRWPDHGTPNPLDLVVFHRNFRHKVTRSQYPILVHCSAGVGRTGTFIGLDVLSRYGKDNGKVNVIEYVKTMRRDRMTMIQNVEQYIFLHHALFEFFRRQGRIIKREDFLNVCCGSANRETMKEITNEFNELSTLKPVYDSEDFTTGLNHLHLNKTQSVLPVEQYLVSLSSHVSGRDAYYNAVTVSVYLHFFSIFFLNQP